MAAAYFTRRRCLLSCLSQSAISSRASPDNDELTGTPGACTLAALAGNDLVRGPAHDDDRGLKDAVDVVSVELRQQVGDHIGRRAASPPRGVRRRRRRIPSRSPSKAAGASGWSNPGTRPGPRLCHLRTVSVLTPKRLATSPLGSLERAISPRTAGMVRALERIARTQAIRHQEYA